MGNFLRAIGRIVMAVITLGQYKANNVADSVYTGSEDGVRAGYTALRDQLIGQFEQVISGVAGIENIKAQKEARLVALNKEEIALQRTLEGIISVVESNPEDMQALEDFNRMDARQHAIDEEQENLATEIADMETKLEDKQMMLNKIKDEINDIKREEEESVSDLALATLEENLAREEMGLKQSINRSGVDAIRNTIRKKQATAKTMSRAAGADTEKRMERYKTQGQATQSNAKLQEILAERAAARKAKEAGGEVSVSNATERNI
ncbi:hypothetical protein KKA17_07695 [bacterium]|nr:hypothetical protein [bacterium]MBU1883273.1 hypothetical protein [bacterium]